MMKKLILTSILFLTFSSYNFLNANASINYKKIQDPALCFEASADAADAWGVIFGNTDQEYLHKVFFWFYDACVGNDQY